MAAMRSCVSSRLSLPRVTTPAARLASSRDPSGDRPRPPRHAHPCAHPEFSLLRPRSFILLTLFPPQLATLYLLTMASIVEKQLQSLLDGFDALRLEYQRVYSRCATLESQLYTAKSQVSAA